jgi:hypothetical protein
MLYPALPLPVTPLATGPVQVLLEHFATALPWLSDAYGLVQTGVANDGKNRVPQLYRQDGGLQSLNLYPDQKMKALCFFEREGQSTVEWKDPIHVAGEWTHSLAVVVWLNLPLIDPLRTYDFTEELLADFLTRGLLQSPLATKLTFEGAEQRNERIFQRYNFPPERQQLLMYPYSGFRVPFTVTQKYDACGPGFAITGPMSQE